MARVLQYANVNFPENSRVEVVLSSTKNAAETAVTSKNLLITITCLILPTSDVEGSNTTNMEAIKSQLQSPGQTFLMSGCGYGSQLLVNSTGGGTWDIHQGPKPQILRWVPIGHDQAAECTWSIEIVLSPCEDTFEGVESFDYSLSHSINRKGYGIWRLSGSLTIASRLLPDGTLTDRDIDSYRPWFLAAMPTMPHEQQESDFSISTDGRTLTGTVTCSEIESPNGFPAGVASISAPFTLSIPFPSTDVEPRHSLSVTIELLPNAERIRAWEIFAWLYEARREGLVSNGIHITPLDMEIQEDWFSHQYSFSISWRASTTLNNILSGSALFRLLENGWVDWNESRQNIQNGRGLWGSAISQLPSRATTLCNQASTPVRETVSPSYSNGFISLFCPDPPSPERSWLKFESNLIESTEYQRVYQSSHEPVEVTQDEFDYTSTTSRPTNRVDTESATLEQYVSNAAPQQKWIWSGIAERIGYPIPGPGKLSIGGKPTTVMGTTRISNRLIGYAFCLPVYRCVWNIGLILDETPDELDNADQDPAEIKKPGGHS